MKPHPRPLPEFREGRVLRAISRHFTLPALVGEGPGMGGNLKRNLLIGLMKVQKDLLCLSNNPRLSNCKPVGTRFASPTSLIHWTAWATPTSVLIWVFVRFSRIPIWRAA